MQSFGMSPEAAGLAEAALGLAGTGAYIYGVFKAPIVASLGSSASLNIIDDVLRSPGSLNKTAAKVEGSVAGAGAATPSGRTFWVAQSEFEGIKVFQRNDIFDPNQVTIWRKGGKVVSGTNLERMAAGHAPIDIDANPVNLHHAIQSNNSAIVEITQTFHQKNTSVIHINPNTMPSGIDRTAFNAWKKRYWVDRAANFKP
jgi:hypothetical protein